MKLINLEKHFVDDRGEFLNIDFPFEIKRVYFIKNNRQGVVRAFHGHEHEKKVLVALSGAWKVIVSDLVRPQKSDRVIDYELNMPQTFNLNGEKKQMLVIQEGKANGFVNLSEEGTMMVLSSSTVEESREDDIRFPWDYFGKEMWGINYR